jgi:hypothetical protein
LFFLNVLVELAIIVIQGVYKSLKNKFEFLSKTAVYLEYVNDCLNLVLGGMTLRQELKIFRPAFC